APNARFCDLQHRYQFWRPRRASAVWLVGPALWLAYRVRGRRLPHARGPRNLFKWVQLAAGKGRAQDLRGSGDDEGRPQGRCRDIRGVGDQRVSANRLLSALQCAADLARTARRYGCGGLPRTDSLVPVDRSLLQHHQPAVVVQPVEVAGPRYRPRTLRALEDRDGVFHLRRRESDPRGSDRRIWIGQSP